MFQVFDKGYQLTFTNGLMLSVMFGRGNYCANRGCQTDGVPELRCQNAELAVFHPAQQNDAIFADGFYGSGACGWNTPEQVAKVTAIVAGYDISRIDGGYGELRRMLRAALV